MESQPQNPEFRYNPNTFTNALINGVLAFLSALRHTVYKAGFIQGSLSKIQGLFKTILQFSRTKSLRKILIEVLKFIFKMLD